jgi:hypothetical protein
MKYPTKQEADDALVIRKEEALGRIQERGEKLIQDRSQVINWNEVSGCSGYEPQLILWTDKMIKEVENLNNIIDDSKSCGNMIHE